MFVRRQTQSGQSQRAERAPGRRGFVTNLGEVSSSFVTSQRAEVKDGLSPFLGNQARDVLLLEKIGKMNSASYGSFETNKMY